MEIKRDLYESVRDHMNAKEITILIGARQVGKTTLLKALQAELIQMGHRVMLLNLDIESEARYFTSQQELLQKIRLEWGEEAGYVFIDEIQRKKNAGRFLKGLYDMDLPYKFVVTGSGSLELKEKIHESLVGRKRTFELDTVSFTEFFHYKTQYRYEGRVNKYFEIENDVGKNLLQEYLNFGGYPRVVTEHKAHEKGLILNEIYQSYIEKDITYLLNIDRPEAFSTMIKLLASRLGQMIVYSNLSQQVSVAVPTLKKYLWYAEKTFVIHKLTPFFTNATKELTKSPHYYFNDIGLRNYALDQLGYLDSPHKMGFVFQNLIFRILKEAMQTSSASLHYWRTTDKAEVDFVIKKGVSCIPIEVKYQSLQKPHISRSFRSFIDKYEPAKAYIVNLFYSDSIKIHKTQIKFIPYYQLLNENL